MSFQVDVWLRGSDVATTATIEGVARAPGSWTDDDFRASIEMFGRTQTRASWLLELVLNGCAAYRTQLFLYLKSCGRVELGTSNLWQGVDAAVPV